MAALAELSTAITALPRSTLLFQPAIVPSVVENSSVLGPELPLSEMTNPGVTLVATPVGDEVPVLPFGAGFTTLRCDIAGSAWPVPSYLVAFPDPLSETQSPIFTPSAHPHGFTIFASV